ncbi:transglycosylase domain-containing protein [Thermotoga sp. KOL6]|uniref:transglycosylase domain-containing protein n=1 Tax=Thermotoga sp. KOL6 TaxID=126741 RepID=UPI000C7779EB|nr:transglycosylase domain-containing protein [Thermotoga sp. KOL6]PLV58365.1 penicillin-binding protein [Thermotoga sp. KOL6]
MKKFILSFLIAFAFTFSVFWSLYFLFTKDLPPPEKRLIPTLRVYYNDGTPLFISRNMWIDLSHVPETFIEMLLTSEDEDFYEHPGFDLKGFLRAIIVDIKTMSFSQGGSTLTQQLARSLYLSMDKSVIRKLKEIFIALWLERIRTKDEILEMYINSVYMGNGIYGFQTAAHYYFGKDLSELSVSEMAILVALIKSPENFNPLKNPDLSKKRAKVVLDRMLSEGKIGKTEYKRYVSELEKLEFHPCQITVDEELFWRIVREAQNIGFSLDELRHGYKVFLTLDRELQELVFRNIQDVKTAFVGIKTKTGEIVAFRGVGIQYGTGWRQVGSAIKPLYYYYALLKGVNPTDLLLDLPIKIDDWKPENFEKDYRGIVSFKEALVDSRNIPSVLLYSHIQPENVKTFIIENLKLRSRYPDDLTASLGTVETSPEELVKVFAAIFNGGIVLEPYMIDRIEDRNSRVVYSGSPKVVSTVPAFVRTPQEASGIMKWIMKEVVERGTGVRARISGKIIAGKTGTAENNAWFIGGDDEYILALVKDGKELLGGRDCAPVWKNIVMNWGKFKGVLTFEEGKEVDQKLIIDENTIKYIDYEELVKLLNDRKISSEKIVKVLKVMSYKYQIELLSNMNAVDPIVSLEIWKRFLREGG